MKQSHLKITFDDRLLYAVPSIHFNHVFSVEVNRICRQQAGSPDAVVVELGPKTALAAAGFLKDLGSGPHSKKKLPVMLGITWQNRMIRAEYKEKAFRLQQETGKDLSELPAEQLYAELDYRGYNILYLSPTDSIIEAIRCSLELDLPLFGVDIEEMASGNNTSSRVQDPIGAAKDFHKYIVRNAGCSALHRDEERDYRREYAMTARLKSIMAKYQRVLFVCGLAHWSSIENLLKDPSIKPALVPEAALDGKNEFKRVVVHPHLAIKYMDIFPALTKEYEHWRQPADAKNPPGKQKRGISPAGIFEQLLQSTCKERFLKNNEQYQNEDLIQDVSSYRDFITYLRNLSFLRLRPVPDMFLLLKTAQQLMSDTFVAALSKVVMNFPWVSPDDYPNYTVLLPPVKEDVKYANTVCFKTPSGKREYVYVGTPPENGGTLSLEIPRKWRDMKKPKGQSIISCLHSWPPWDNLVSARAYDAARQTKKYSFINNNELFKTQLLDGIDIKSTIKARFRGEDDVYVQNFIKKVSHNHAKFSDSFPVVYLFSPGQHANAELAALYESCEWMEQHILNWKRFDKKIRENGDLMIAVIAYGEKYISSKASQSNSRVRTDRYHGLVMYQPISWSKKQFTRWVELSDFQRNPYCQDSYLGGSFKGELSELGSLLQNKLNIKLSEFDWTTTLMLFAIPFAEDSLMVIAPDDYKIEPVVFAKANQYGVKIQRTSLSQFSQEDIERMSMSHMMPAEEIEPKRVYSKSIIEALGESPERFIEIVPESWRHFGEDLERDLMLF